MNVLRTVHSLAETIHPHPFLNTKGCCWFQSQVGHSHPSCSSLTLGYLTNTIRSQITPGPIIYGKAASTVAFVSFELLALLAHCLLLHIVTNDLNICSNL
jgi:hypothetical protein